MYCSGSMVMDGSRYTTVMFGDEFCLSMQPVHV